MPKPNSPIPDPPSWVKTDEQKETWRTFWEKVNEDYEEVERNFRRNGYATPVAPDTPESDEAEELWIDIQSETKGQ